MDPICGLLIEPRKIKQVFYIINNFFAVLPNCNLYFFCGKGLTKYYNFLTNEYNLLHIIELSVNNLDYCSYSDFMKNKKLWELFKEDFCLTIQTDGCLCKNSTYDIRNFLNYDYIGGGTVRTFQKNIYYNGGFSLRKIKSMIKVLNYITPLKTKKENFFIKILKYTPFFNMNFIKSYGEDVYFYYGCKFLNLKVGNDNFSYNFCLHELNKINNLNNFCIHKLNIKYFSFYDIFKIIHYCPEYKYYLYPIKNIDTKIISENEINKNFIKLIKKKIYYLIRFNLCLFIFFIAVYYHVKIFI